MHYGAAFADCLSWLIGETVWLVCVCVCVVLYYYFMKEVTPSAKAGINGEPVCVCVRVCSLIVALSN